MSAPFAWDASVLSTVVPPAQHRSEREHRRELRDFAVQVASAGFLLMYRPPAIVAFSRAITTANMSPVVNNAWAQVNTFATVIGDPIFSVPGQDFPDTALTIDANSQVRLCDAVAGLKLENIGGAPIDIEVGFGFSIAPVQYIQSMTIPAGGNRWCQVQLPLVEMGAPASLWVRSTVAASLVVHPDTWFSLNLGVRWR